MQRRGSYLQIENRYNVLVQHCTAEPDIRGMGNACKTPTTMRLWYRKRDLLAVHVVGYHSLVPRHSMVPWVHKLRCVVAAGHDQSFPQLLPPAVLQSITPPIQQQEEETHRSTPAFSMVTRDVGWPRWKRNCAWPSLAGSSGGRSWETSVTCVHGAAWLPRPAASSCEHGRFACIQRCHYLFHKAVLCPSGCHGPAAGVSCPQCMASPIRRAHHI